MSGNGNGNGHGDKDLLRKVLHGQAQIVALLAGMSQRVADLTRQIGELARNIKSRK